VSKPLNKDKRLEQAPAIHPTGWNNPPALTDLKADLTSAEADHSNVVSKVVKWEENLKGTLSAEVKIPKNKSTIQPKLIRKQAEWRYSALSEPFLSSVNIFKADPVTYEDVRAAKQNELVLNHQFNNKLRKVPFINKYVRSAVNKGTSIIKTGWVYKDKVEKVIEPIYQFEETDDEQYIAYLEEVIQAYQADPITFERKQDKYVVDAIQLSMADGVPYIPVQIGEQEVDKVTVIANHPTAEIRPLRNVIIDPTCEGDYTKANFIIDQFESSLSALQEAGIYSNLEYINIDNASPLSASTTELANPSSFMFKDKPRKKIVVHEYWGYWDIDGSGVTKPIVASFVGDVLIRLADNPYPHGKLPFVVVPYLPVEDSVYGEPDGELLEDNQKVIGAVTRGMVDLMAKNANGQRGVAKDALDYTNLKRYKAGEDYEFNPNTHPERAFFIHKFADIPRSAEYMLNIQNNEAEGLTGVKAFHNGISGGALGNTATGVRSALDATSKRDLEILLRLAEGIIEVGRQFTAMNAVFLDEPEVVRITNEEFEQIDSEDLAGSIDIRLTISTAETDNAKAEQLAFMLQTTGQTLGLEMIQLVLAEIADLRKMPELSKKIKMYQPQPDPIEQEKAMLEVELLKAQIQQISGKAYESQSTAILNQTKAGTEQAKQKMLSSTADKLDLDFVEQRTGTTQARELEKQGEQARANMALAALKESISKLK